MEQVDPPRRERGSADTQLMKTTHATAREAKEVGDICASGIHKHRPCREFHLKTNDCTDAFAQAP